MGYMKRRWEEEQESAVPEQGDYPEDWEDHTEDLDEHEERMEVMRRETREAGLCWRTPELCGDCDIERCTKPAPEM